MSHDPKIITVEWKHTPGVWVVEQNGRQVWGGPFEGKPLATLSGKGAERMANARLMAAAPGAMATLAAFVETVEAVANSNGAKHEDDVEPWLRKEHDGDGWPDLAIAYSMAKGVLRKALEEVKENHESGKR